MMPPTTCRVHVNAPEPHDESAGTIGVTGDGEGTRFTLTAPNLEVIANLSRDESLAFLLAGADALDLVLLDPKDAARRTAAKMRRERP